MANFKKLARSVGGREVYVNVEQVTYVTQGREAGRTLIQFGPEGSSVLVEGDAKDVMDILWPAAEQAPPGR